VSPQAGVLVLLAVAAAAAACSPADNHLLYGQEYEPTGACLAPAQAIDDVAGPDPGTCAPRCLQAATADGGPAMFITTTCPPYPSYLALVAQDAGTSAGDLCKAAFAAYASDSVCGSDAGRVLEAGIDEGSDADVATDARPDADAGVEAAVDAPAGG
jgi:hypothetical protein